MAVTASVLVFDLASSSVVERALKSYHDLGAIAADGRDVYYRELAVPFGLFLVLVVCWLHGQDVELARKARRFAILNGGDGGAITPSHGAQITSV